MKYIANILLISLVLLSCRQKVHNHSNDFRISTLALKCEKPIVSAVGYHNKIFCLQNNGRLFLLDSNFVADSSFVLNNKVKLPVFHDMMVINDSLIFLSGFEAYYLTRTNKIEVLQNPVRPFFKGHWHDDSNYYVYDCNNGEWSGSITFVSKKTAKTFSYPLVSPLSVLNQNGKYYLFSSHSKDIFQVANPESLFPDVDTGNRPPCQYFDGIAKYYPVADSQNNKMNVIHEHLDSTSINFLCPFFYKNELYIIGTNEQQTILVKKEKNQLKTIDTLLKRPLHFQFARSGLFGGDLTVCSYFETMGSIDSTGKAIENYENTGVLLVKNNEITILEFNTPVGSRP